MKHLDVNNVHWHHLCKGVINILDNYGIKQLNNGTTFGIW